VPGGAAGLQNQSGGRKVPGGFDSLPSPPEHADKLIIQRSRQLVTILSSQSGTEQSGPSAQRLGGHDQCLAVAAAD
jgi:hypothetical protein